MKKIILPVLILLSCSTFAEASCRVIEYPDHTEAVCGGDTEQTSTPSQEAAQDQIVVSSENNTEPEQKDVPIVRNDFARAHAASWLSRTARPNI